MTSVEPSPPKRIKLAGGQPPSKIPLLLRPQSQSQSQSSSTSSTTTTTTTTITTNGKPAPVLAASSSLRFRRISSPRLSQSPVRKPAPATPNFFHNTDVGSSVTRMGSTAGSPQDQSTPTPTPTPTPRPPRPALAEKPSGNGSEKRPLEQEQQEEEALKEPSPQPPPPPPPSPPPPRDKDEEALRRLLADRVATLKADIEALKDEREREEARIERETSAARKAAAAAAAAATTPEGEALQALLRRLLAANDASHTVLPELPKLGAGEGEEEEVVPSVRPRDSGDVGAFHCLTFTRTSCGIYTPAPNTTTTEDNEAPLQKYTASGYASARLLAFTVSFLVDPRSASVRSLSATVSAWARAELGAPLAAAEDTGDVAGALYALSSYAVMARRRAAVWARCERSFPELLRRGKGTAAAAGGRRDLVRWLGRSVLVFCRKGGGAELVVGWAVGVDCVGEAESVLTADVRFPGGWKDADDRGSLRKVGEVFTALVKERGVFEAVRCVVGLVFQ